MFGALGLFFFMITYTLGAVSGAETTCGGTVGNAPPKEYFISTKQLIAEEAAEECRKMNMTLATERTNQEYEAIGRELLKKDPNTTYWLSGHRGNRTTFWVWSEMEDPEGDRINNFHFNRGEPNNVNKNESCVVTFVINGKQVWNDVPCADKSFFICEKSKIDDGPSADREVGV